jgi:hypothetical protein
MAGMYLKIKENFLSIFGNNPVLAAYGKMSVDSIPQTGKYRPVHPLIRRNG